ncbi:MAG: hypothetical protein R6W80_03390 [Haliea sp.]
MNRKNTKPAHCGSLTLAGVVVATLSLAAPAAANQGYGRDLGANNREVRAQLEQLRKVVVGFHSYDVARAAGWDEAISPCVEDLTNGTGGMGFHIANMSELGNGTVSLLRPEALMYAPMADGSMEFLGVEYIVPDPAMALSDPPELLGQTFAYNPELGIWALHVWLERHNPLGLFAPYNPTVSCEFAPPPDGE